MKAISEMTNKELKEEAKSLHQLIHSEVMCYGTRDLRLYDAILAELDKRGIDMSTKLAFK